MFDPEEVRKDFPILTRKINGHPLVYLDSTATSQKPQVVLDSITDYYSRHNANVHRGAHTLGDEASKIYEEARESIADFIGATHPYEIIFLRNATEALNLLAYSWGGENLKKGDVVVISEMEHHANIVPWQQLANRSGCELRLVSVTKDGTLDMKDFAKKIKGAKLLSIVHVSNALGTINPVKEMIEIAKDEGVLVSLDGAQGVPHMKIDVVDLGCDFYSFSGHKMLGPMGTGVLWGRRELLEKMPPFLTGGGMISAVYESHAEWAELPDKFDAGTPDVASAVGLVAAVNYLDRLGMDNVREHDRQITAYALERLSDVEGVNILGPRDPEIRSGSVSFVYEIAHAHDVATILDSEGVGVRSGHHCTMVLHNKLGVAASVRASWNVYTTKQDIDSLVDALDKVREILG